MSIYTNEFTRAPKGIEVVDPETNEVTFVKGAKNALNSVGPLCNPLRRSRNHYRRLLGLTGKAYRKMEKKVRRNRGAWMPKAEA